MNEQDILNALIQAGISRPRADLSEERIRAAVSRFDPSKPIWPRNRQKKVPAPIKGTETAARMRAHYLAHGRCFKSLRVQAEAIDTSLSQ